MAKEKKIQSPKIDGRTVAAKKKRVTNEETRLLKIFEKLPPDLLHVAQGLIRRAAYMRITLEDCEKDLDENGTVELFQQSPTQPAYERLRPAASNYNTLNKNYQSIMKQLVDLLPKGEDDVPAAAKGDGFEAFVNKKPTT